LDVCFKLKERKRNAEITDLLGLELVSLGYQDR